MAAAWDLSIQRADTMPPRAWPGRCPTWPVCWTPTASPLPS
jgi:hypothetical protein